LSKREGDSQVDHFASAEELRALEALLDFGESEVKGGLRVKGDPYELALIVALFSRATTTYRALLVLIEQGYGQQAMMLNRVGFELMVDSYWIEGNRELAKDRFLEHARFHHHLRRELGRRYPSLIDGEPNREAGEDTLEEGELRKLQKRYTAHGGKSWTAQSVHQKVEAIVEKFADPEDREQLRGFRDIIHRLNNEEMHPTPWSISRVLRRRPTEDGGETLQFRIGPEPELGELALRTGWWIYLQFLHLVISTFEMSLEDRLQALREGAPWADRR
jgi:Family of unknown function (DUF5677)